MAIEDITASVLGLGTVPTSFAPAALRRFTVDQYHRMIEANIIGENDRVELVNGWIVEMSPIGPPHMTCVSLLAAILQERLPRGWTSRVQGPVTLSNSEPEPDIAIVRGSIRDYVKRYPSGADIGLVIEVTDTSLELDRQQKLPQYAAAGILEYWIVNLIDRCVETYRNPTGSVYREPDVVSAGGRLKLNLPGSEAATFSVAEILP